MKAKATLLLLLCLAACAGDDAPAPVCPEFAIAPDLGRLADYGREPPAARDLVVEATVAGVSGDCDFDDDGATIALTVDFMAGRGPRLGGDYVELPYLVAVVDADGDVTAKQNLSVLLAFDDDDEPAAQTEEIAVTLPNLSDGAGYRVLAGFQLSPEQLADNRGEQEPQATAAPRLPVWGGP